MYLHAWWGGKYLGLHWIWHALHLIKYFKWIQGETNGALWFLIGIHVQLVFYKNEKEHLQRL